nr:hypothetical protein [uncultured Gellertiella sp.]
MRLPRSRSGRIALGSGLLAGGALGFLPVLGFWMIPLGLVVLSHDVAAARRLRRKSQVWWQRRHARKAAKRGDLPES